MSVFASFSRCFILFLVFSSSLSGESLQWQSSYILMRNEKVVGTETFTIGHSDGFNLISGNLLVAQVSSAGGEVSLSKKFKLRAIPPFFEPLSSVISVSNGSGAPLIKRAIVSKRVVNFQGTAAKVSVGGDRDLIFLDPHCNISFSALIQAYDMSEKGAQKFETVDTAQKLIVPVTVDYRGEDSLSSDSDINVRCFSISGIGSEDIFLKADKFGKILFIHNSYGGWDAFLEGTIVNPGTEISSQTKDSESSSKRSFKELKVAIGVDKTVVEASFHLPQSLDDKLPGAIVLSDIDGGGRSLVNNTVISLLMKNGCAVLELPLSRGFSGDVSLVNSGIKWLRKRQEIDSSMLLGIANGLSFAPLWEVAASKEGSLQGVVLIEPSFETAGSLVLSELDEELSNDGYTDEFKSSVREKFQRFLHNVNTQSQGYQGVLKHSIDEVKGWEFEMALRILSNPRAFDGYILTSFPERLKLLHIPLFISSGSIERTRSLHQDKLQDMSEKQLSSQAAVSALEAALSDKDYQEGMSASFKAWLSRFFSEK